MKPLFPYPGGKRRLAKHILPLLREQFDRFRGQKVAIDYTIGGSGGQSEMIYRTW